jgi:hypothetical protein
MGSTATNATPPGFPLDGGVADATSEFGRLEAEIDQVRLLCIDLPAFRFSLRPRHDEEQLVLAPRPVARASVCSVS